MNLGFRVIFFALDSDEIAVFHIHRFNHINDIVIIGISVVDLVMCLRFGTFSFVRCQEWLFESLVIRICVVPIHN